MNKAFPIQAEDERPVATPWRATRAFTLVELLVCLTLLSMLVVFLSQIISFTGGAWNSGEASKERLQNVRALTDFMGKELAAALLPANRINQSGLQFVVNPPGIADSFMQPCAAFWQASLALDQSLGDVAEIGYFVKWDTANYPGNPRARLCRFFVGPTDPANYRIHSHPDSWLSDEILNTVAPANKAGAYQGVFIENVIGLWIRCLDTRGQEITKNHSGDSFPNKGFDSRQGYTDSLGVQTASFTDANGDVHPLCTLPPVVEISIVLLDGAAATRVGADQQRAIQEISNNAANAGDFIASALSDSRLKAIHREMKAFQTQIYLPNSQ